MKQLLGRTYDPKTATWRGSEMTPIPDEVMEHINRPGATMLDLLYVLSVREALAAQARGVDHG